MSQPERYAIAIDIGGTKIKAALVAGSGQMQALTKTDTPKPATPENVIPVIVDQIQRLLAQIPTEALAGVGISIAAFITSSGVVTATAHLDASWVGYDLKVVLMNTQRTNYYFALDTPAPALGEAYYGAGQGIDHFVYVTVSTGIGAGILMHGRYFIGGLGWAGGVGHIIIDENSPRVCAGCGNHGCLETFAATQGIITTAQEIAAQYPNSDLNHVVNGDLERLTPKDVFAAAQTGDPAALQVTHQVGHALGIGLTNLVNIVSPTHIVIGGGISQAGDLLLEPVRAVIRERAFPPQHRQAQVVQAALGDLSGVYGAAAMVFHDLHINPLQEMSE